MKVKVVQMSRRKGTSDSKKHSAYSQHIKAKIIGAIVTLVLCSLYAVISETQSAFSETSTAIVTAKSDSLSAPTGLKLKSLVGGQTELSWTASSNSYVTGYKILRSDNTYGPWTELGSVQGRSTTTFTDTTSGTIQWIYRVEAIWNKWMSVSPGFEAPPAVGREFFDSFSVLGDLNGRITEDGKSIWQVWNGKVIVENKNNWPVAAFGTGYEEGPATAVVRTPTQNARIFIEDLDGSEGVILRGKDPDNYIYAGGAKGGGSADASFEIVEVKDGVRKVLQSGSTGTINRDMRIEINESLISIYIDAKEGQSSSGTLFMSQATSFLANDPTATYFGIGLNGTNGILGFYFEAI